MDVIIWRGMTVKIHQLVSQCGVCNEFLQKQAIIYLLGGLVKLPLQNGQHHHALHGISLAPSYR